MNIGAGGTGFGAVHSVLDPGATAGLIDVAAANGGPQLQTADSTAATAEFGSGFAIITVLPANVGVEGWEQEVYQVGDAHARAKVSGNGSIRFGSGAAVPDTTLARIGAGQLQANGGIGFFGVAPPAAKPATPVTLADVIARLQAYGMVA